MKIGILGSGIVGRTLASAFLSEGNDVMLGTRDTGKEEVMNWQEENKKGKTGSFAETAAFGEWLVLATSGKVVSDMIMMSGPANFDNKIVIDATNPIENAPPENGVIKYFTSLDDSLMERIQRQIPGARLVKAFNSVGYAHMYKPSFSSPPSMFICGNDPASKEAVSALLHDFGWEAEDMGGVEAARAIEPLAILWCIPGFIRNQWSHAFKLLKN